MDGLFRRKDLKVLLKYKLIFDICPPADRGFNPCKIKMLCAEQHPCGSQNPGKSFGFWVHVVAGHSYRSSDQDSFGEVGV